MARFAALANLQCTLSELKRRILVDLRQIERQRVRVFLRRARVEDDNLLVRLHEEGTTIVMVTHSADNAAYAERTVRMLDGRVLAEQTPGLTS